MPMTLSRIFKTIIKRLELVTFQLSSELRLSHRLISELYVKMGLVLTKDCLRETHCQTDMQYIQGL